MKNQIICISFLVAAFTVGGSASPVLNDVSYWPTLAGYESSAAPGSEGLTVSTSEPGGYSLDLNITGAGLYSAADLWATSSQFTSGLASGSDPLRVSFTFQSMTMAPNQDYGSLAVYFQYGATSADRWYYELTPPSTLNPATYMITLNNSSGWVGAGNINDFLANLGTANQLGFEVIAANTTDLQTYRFSDIYFSTPVPEPETIWMIVMVLASLAITFRGRLTDIVGQLKARIKT